MQLPRRRRSAQINIVPLIDVLVVLLFFILMTMQFRVQRLLEIEVPEVESAGQQERAQPLVIEVDAEGQVAVAGALVAADQLRERLRELAATEPSSILIHADKRASVESLAGVVDAIRLAGLPSNVSLVTH
ncbi:MAG: ExbD/TolR family protein [Opitutales bacterium]